MTREITVIAKFELDDLIHEGARITPIHIVKKNLTREMTDIFSDDEWFCSLKVECIDKG